MQRSNHIYAKIYGAGRWRTHVAEMVTPRVVSPNDFFRKHSPVPPPLVAGADTLMALPAAVVLVLVSTMKQRSNPMTLTPVRILKSVMEEEHVQVSTKV